ncbi:MAG: efflux RND transporter periplasmic adaptor subunit [Nitrospira sp.]|jgi:RND family efflux transporter MFP subunit|nr:efflux RND transporter periplasmic adaptor subunit [Nitrospira sp.]MBX3339773.1 efflux RND transporter periplasmic adaptor subunit [Nitrospira sp.]MCC7470546.1 efflux RND transporter periplasmic adaptor subunit [Candidatus Nomurabacteria bacterium]
MLKLLHQRSGVLSGFFLLLVYLCYRIYESNVDATTLRKQTLEDTVPTVAVTYPTPVPPTETISLPGNIQAWFEAPIYAQVSGYVKMWYKDYGALVKKGDILAEINAPALDAQYAQAKADLAAEQAKYALADLTAKRWVALRKNHAVSEQSISVQEANAKAEAARVKASEQNVKNFEALIQFKTIVAPYDGVVTVRNINVGDYINKEGNISNRSSITNLFTVADVSMLRLFVNVPASFGAFLKPGLTADVTVPQLPDRHFTAKFLTVARGFDVSTRTAVTVFTIDNEDRALWPGSYAQVHLTAPVDRNALTIPSTALVFQEHGTQVAVVTEDDRVHLKPITVSKLMDNAVEVAGGLSSQDRVVNNPSAALLEGDKVRVVTPAPGYDLVGSTTPVTKDPSSK